MNRFLTGCLIASSFAVVCACSQQTPPQSATNEDVTAQADGPQPAQTQAPEAAKPAAVNVPAGAYTLDRAHASLIMRLDHLGFSRYTARFKRFDAQLQFDPSNLAASTLTATVDPRSIETDYPDPAQIDFNGQLQSEQWLDVAKFPQITFRSTAIEVTGPNAMRVNGELALHGVTRPMSLDVVFNGGYVSHPMDPRARIGFSAKGSFKRSEFGMAYGVPDPGSTMGVGDAVEVVIEVEFSGPPSGVRQSDTPPEKS